MKVSIIIPTLNESHYIKPLLTSIQKQTHPILEVLVIDGGSVDNTVEIVKSFRQVNCFYTDQPVGNQRTVGGFHASGDLLIFLDADVQLEKDFIARVLGEMKRRSLDIACPQYTPFPGTVFIRIFYAVFNTLFALVQNKKASGAGSCICVKKDLFKRIGGFDARMHFDDIVFIRKASKLGKFGILHSSIHVSDRRFRQYGFLQTCITYVYLAVLFAFGFFRQANNVPYIFGKFSSITKKKV